MWEKKQLVSMLSTIYSTRTGLEDGGCLPWSDPTIYPTKTQSAINDFRRDVYWQGSLYSVEKNNSNAVVAKQNENGTKGWKFVELACEERWYAAMGQRRKSWVTHNLTLYVQNVLLRKVSSITCTRQQEYLDSISTVTRICEILYLQV